MLVEINEKIDWLKRNERKLDTHIYQKHHRVLHREKALWDPYWFIETIIGYPDLHEPLHRPMIEWVAWGSGREKLEMYPRGHFKSSVLTIGYSTWRILRNPEIRIQINNAVLPTAVSFAETIQKQFRQTKETGPLNRRMAWLFPDFILPPIKHAAATFSVPVKQTLWKKESTIESSAIGSEDTGHHFDLIVNDDLVTKKCLKESYNQSCKDYYTGQSPLLDPPPDPTWPDQTARLTIGTHYGENELYSDMQNNVGDMCDDDFVCRKLGLKYKRRDRTFNPNGRFGDYIFPTRWNKKKERSEYTKMRKQPGGEFMFYSQYYNETRNRSNIKFDRSMFHRVQRNDPALRNLSKWRKVLLIDPSTTKQYYSDPSALIDLRVSPRNQWLIAGIINKAMNSDELVQLIYRIAARENGLVKDFHKIIFESRGLQKTYLTALKYYGMLPREDNPNGLTLPLIEPVKRKNNDSKEDYIDMLLPMYREGAIWHLDGIPNLTSYENQLLSHRNNPKHDDMMDCVAFACGAVSAPFGDEEEDDEPEDHGIQGWCMNDIKNLQREMMQSRMRGGQHHGRGVQMQGVA